MQSISKQSKLKEFFYKLAHRIFITKKELHLYEIEDNKSCHYCGDEISLLHSFLGCHIATDFPQNVLCWFYEKENSSITINSEEILFGVATDNDNRIKKLNFCLLSAEFYFHFQKINQRACNWNVFLRKLNFMLKVESFASLNFSSIVSQSKQNKQTFHIISILLRKLNRIYPVEISCSYVIVLYLFVA